MLEIAEAIAPTWERRRAEIEEVATPVREWLLRELRPHQGATVLELAAGVGETGFDAAAIIGETGRLITTDFSPAMLEAAPTPRRRARRDERRLPAHGRRADRARRRLGRRSGVPLRLHADGRSRSRARRDTPGATAWRQAGAGGMGRGGAKPVLRIARDAPRRARHISSRRSHPRRPGPSACPTASTSKLCCGAPASPRFAPRRCRSGSRCRASTST